MNARFRALAIGGLLALAMALPVAAVEEPDLPALDEHATLKDYLLYAELNNAGLRAAFERWRAAIERIPQAKTLPDPRFTYGYFIRSVETRVGPQENTFGLSQTFPWFGKLRLQGDVAAEAAEAARQKYESARLRVVYQVKDAYFEYFYLGRAIAVVRSNRDLVKYIEGVARTRYKAAAARYPDVIRAQVELGKLEDRLATLLDLEEPLRARLNAALNRPLDASLVWPRTAPYEPLDATGEQLADWLRADNHELEGLRHDVLRQQKAQALANRQYYPDITLGVNYIDTGKARMHGVDDSGKDPILATVSVSLPIWVGKYRAAVNEARELGLAAARSRVQRENDLSSEVKLVHYRLRDAARKISLYGDSLLPKANESLKATQTAYEAGTASFLDLLDADRVLLEFSLSRERALADYNQRFAELEMLVGRPLPRTAAAESAKDKTPDAERDKARVKP